jgi:hypothetical protein
MKVELSTEEALSVVASLNETINTLRYEYIRARDKVSRRNLKLRMERKTKLKNELFQQVEENLLD